jgi:hypothetical protein
MYSDGSWPTCYVLTFLSRSCSRAPIRKQTPTKNQPELATSSHISKFAESKYGTVTTPRARQIKAIVTSADLRNGMRLISPAPENAYAVQVNIKLAIAKVLTGAKAVPCAAESTTDCGAFAKTYQLGPPMIQNRCHTAVAAAITPPISKNLELVLVFNAC